MKHAWPEYWIVDGKRVEDENLGEYGAKPEQCINCGAWFCMEETTICGICHRRMIVCCLVFEQVLGLHCWYPGLVILPDFSGYTFNEAYMQQLREKRGA